MRSPLKKAKTRGPDKWQGLADQQTGLKHVLDASADAPGHRTALVWEGQEVALDRNSKHGLKVHMRAGVKHIDFLTLTWIFQRPFVSEKSFWIHQEMKPQPFQIFPRKKLRLPSLLDDDQHLFFSEPHSTVQRPDVSRGMSEAARFTGTLTPGSGATDKECDSRLSPWAWPPASRAPPCWHQSWPSGSSGWNYFCFQPHPWLHLKKQQAAAPDLVWTLPKASHPECQSAARPQRAWLLRASAGNGESLGQREELAGPEAFPSLLTRIPVRELVNDLQLTVYKKGAH